MSGHKIIVKKSSILLLELLKLLEFFSGYFYKLSFVLYLILKVRIRLINVKRYREVYENSVTSTSFILDTLIQRVLFVVHYICKSN